MMKRSAMFLMELILMILVFSVCAAICVSLLGRAYAISQSSERLTQAVYLAEAAATRIQGGMPYEPEEEGDYQVRLFSEEGENGLYEVQIFVSFGDEEIYNLAITSQEAPV